MITLSRGVILGELTLIGDEVGLCPRWRDTLPAVAKDGVIHDGPTVHTFPGVEGKKIIRQAFQVHEAFTLWTFHKVTSCYRLATGWWLPCE